MSKRAAEQIPAYPMHKTGGAAPPQQDPAKRAKHAGGSASPGAAAPPNDPVYDAFNEAVEQSVRAKRLWTLDRGTEAQVNNEINGFYRTEKGKDHSSAFGEEENPKILVGMKTAMEELKVRNERCFWINEGGEILSKYNPIPIKSWEKADGLKKSIARLAWLMQNDEE